MSTFATPTAWQPLSKHHQSLQTQHLKDLFANDPDRQKKLSISIDEIEFDYSKQFITHDTLQLLSDLATRYELKNKIQAMFNGEKINTSENRAALHTALRAPATTPIVLDGKNIKLEIQHSLEQVFSLVNQLHNKTYLGATDLPIDTIISLGIGGSDLGPRMTCKALAAYANPNIKIHFLSNVDGWSLQNVLTKCNPATTLCIINSKTFTTPETLCNAKSIIDWFKSSLPKFQKHLFAVTSLPQRAIEFGISEENVFKFWDWVGGRYSIWSAVGLPLAISIGVENFKAFLQGAFKIDQHFLNTPILQNIPALIGLIGFWNRNFLQLPTLAILPYSDRLKLYPSYLQQLEMESNGKSCDIDGKPISYDTCPIIWGNVGCDCQHSFMQLIHQSNQTVPIDFILTSDAVSKYQEQQKLLLKSANSQSKALTYGSPANELPIKVCPGNRPHSIITLKSLNPFNLGALIAIYEHKTFTQSVLWNINPFDQWGVELGKKL
jgi:glucose-6-phosphate isomerase